MKLGMNIKGVISFLLNNVQHVIPSNELNQGFLIYFVLTPNISLKHGFIAINSQCLMTEVSKIVLTFWKHFNRFKHNQIARSIKTRPMIYFN